MPPMPNSEGSLLLLSNKIMLVNTSPGPMTFPNISSWPNLQYQDVCHAITKHTFLPV